MLEQWMLLLHFLRPNYKNMETKATPKVKTWKLAKGDKVQITGLPFTITDKLLQDPNVIIAIERYEKRSKRQYFGTHIVEA